MAVADALVDEHGAPGDIQLISPSGVREVDDEVLRDLQTRRFLPAEIDGIPVAARYRTDGRNRPPE
ncbi:MAG: energy transducer TonB [Gemmatimonadales bacterium]|nr:energy transducer TonB [Gemmatimonadales bacterium]